MESRGNFDLWDGPTHVGNEQMSSTHHFGPREDINGYPTSQFHKNRSPRWYAYFHTYKMIWTDSQLQFYVDDDYVGTVYADNGFWERGNFTGSGLPNLWASGTQMAPFDQEFFIILCNGVGGGFFPDNFENRNGGKPWVTWAESAMTDFWRGRQQWEPS